MAGEQVRLLDDEGPVMADEVRLSSLGHQERQDLQQWILADPTLLESGLLILTEEYGRWSGVDGSSVRDRLDLLAIDQAGRLVVIELKRDDAPTDVHLQAITYAAMVSRFTEDDVVHIYAEFLRRKEAHIADEEARERILNHVGGELDAQGFRQPRLLLVAREFPRQVTSSAVWLNEMGIEVTLVSVRVWRAGYGLVLTTSTYYPVPGTEEFTVVPAREETARAARRTSDRVRAKKSIVRIIESGAAEPGQAFVLRPHTELSVEIREQVQAWVNEDEARRKATWVNDQTKPLRWAVDQRQYAPTTLVKEIVERATGSRPNAVWGPRWWVDERGRDLVVLAEGNEDEG